MPPPRRLEDFLAMPPATRSPLMVLKLLHLVVYAALIVDNGHPLACIVESSDSTAFRPWATMTDVCLAKPMYYPDCLPVPHVL